MSKAPPTTTNTSYSNSSNATLPNTIKQFLRQGWKTFGSLKFGIFLLGVIGVTAIYGTMMYASNAALGDNAIPMARGRYFETPWFTALLALFSIQLIVSTWHVTKMSFTIWFKKEFKRQDTFYKYGKAPRAEIHVDKDQKEIFDFLKKKFTFAHQEGNTFFAHKGLLSRLGPTIVHIGILTVLGSVIIRTFLIWSDRAVTEGRFGALEGETSNVLIEPIDISMQVSETNRRETPLPFYIRVLDFDVINFPNSDVPQYFSSLVEILDPERQIVKVVQLDMNNSLTYGGLTFHQASYMAIEGMEEARMNFDVRDRKTGRRIAVTDTIPNFRVRIGETDLFLEVDGKEPGDQWRIYHREEPLTVKASGILSGPPEDTQYNFLVASFYNDFRVDPATNQPMNASNRPNNPALEFIFFEDGEPVEKTWLFYDQELAAMVPPPSIPFAPRLRDIRTRQDIPMEEINWNDTASVIFEIAMIDQATGESVGSDLVRLNQQSETFLYRNPGAFEDAPLTGTEGDFLVRIAGPTQRYMTVFTVVSEPTTPYTTLGVIIIVLGAMMTFVFRYRALYGMFDEKTGTLKLALIPRWGQSVVDKEFREIIAQLSPETHLSTGKVIASQGDEAPPAVYEQDSDDSEKST